MEYETHEQVKHRKIYILKLLLRSGYYRLKSDDTKMMTVIADGFLDLGGVYVKFLQGVLLQLPVMKLWNGDKRFDVYENVPVDLIDVESFLKSNLSTDKLSIIKSIATEPFAAGSFGQVYRGTLIDGQEVIFKLLRPNIQKLLKRDLRLIRLVSKLLASIFTNWDVDLKVLVKGFVRSTFAEIDYKSEAKFAVEAYKYYFSNPVIVIPKTYLDLSNKTIIVQEYIEGISLAKLLKEHSSRQTNFASIVYSDTGSDLKYQLTQLGVELNKAILHSGPIHGDPHPGNIRMLSDNRVALLDFGIQAKPFKSPNAYYKVLKEFWRAEYLNSPDPGSMFVAYIRFYSGRLYESMQIVSELASKKTGAPIQLDKWIIESGNKLFKQKISPEALLNGLDRIRAGKSAKDISVDNIVNPGNRFQISVRLNDGAIIRTMATYLSLVTELGYRSIIAEVYNQVVEYVKEALPNLEKEPELSVKPEEAVQIVYAWLEKIAQTDSKLYLEILNHIKGFDG